MNLKSKFLIHNSIDLMYFHTIFGLFLLSKVAENQLINENKIHYWG